MMRSEAEAWRMWTLAFHDARGESHASRKGKRMDIEYAGRVERGVSECVVGSHLWTNGYRYQRKDGAALVIFGSEWEPVKEWVTIEVERDSFRDYLDLKHDQWKAPNNSCGVLFANGAHPIRWRRKGPHA